MLSNLFTDWARGGVDQIRSGVRKIRYAGGDRLCPVCGGSASHFKEYGVAKRKDSQCPYCGSQERHRFVWLYLQRKTDFFSTKKPRKMLHVAPEPCFERRFKRFVGSGYLTADLMNPRAMVKMDITDIRYPDNTFDIVYCSHVLEHVPDDRKAMREFRRVLKPDGWAILLVPMQTAPTYEDWTITAPEAREKAFGQYDHVRIYGPDYVGRLEESGFKVEKTVVRDLVSETDATRMGMTRSSGDIYRCTKAGN